MDKDENTFYYTMKPGETVYNAVVAASLHAGNNGYNAYVVLDSNGKELKSE